MKVYKTIIPIHVLEEVYGEEEIGRWMLTDECVKNFNEYIECKFDRLRTPDYDEVREYIRNNLLDFEEVLGVSENHDCPFNSYEYAREYINGVISKPDSEFFNCETNKWELAYNFGCWLDWEDIRDLRFNERRDERIYALFVQYMSELERDK